MVEVLRARKFGLSFFVCTKSNPRNRGTFARAVPFVTDKGTDLLTKVKLIRILITVFKLADLR